MTFKLKRELGFKEPPPPMEPYIRAPYRRNVVTPEMADQAMIDLAKTYGISVENKSVEEIREELTLKRSKSRG